MAVFPLKADIHQRGLHVRLVPQADIHSIRPDGTLAPTWLYIGTWVVTSLREQNNHLRRMSERKILYYPNPMGAPDTSLVPKKDPMGMDCIRPNVLSISRKHARRSRG
jgi:hypothetical protein